MIRKRSLCSDSAVPPCCRCPSRARRARLRWSSAPPASVRSSPPGLDSSVVSSSQSPSQAVPIHGSRRDTGHGNKSMVYRGGVWGGASRGMEGCARDSCGIETTACCLFRRRAHTVSSVCPPTAEKESNGSSSQTVSAHIHSTTRACFSVNPSCERLARQTTVHRMSSEQQHLTTAVWPSVHWAVAAHETKVRPNLIGVLLVEGL